MCTAIQKADVTSIHSQHDALPREPVHPAIYLNAALRDSTAHSGSSRILSSYPTTLPNLGNVAASAYFRSSEDGIVKSASVWRRAESAGGRATAVGWGAFKPTPIDARPKSRKGKERAVDEHDMFEEANVTTLRCDGVALHTTPSPIQQLQLASYPRTSRLLLACRSHTSLDLVHLDAAGQSGGETTMPASLSCFRYSGAHLNKRPIADCALGGVATGYGQTGAGLVVDTEGALFGFGLDENGSSRLGHPAWGGFQPQMYRLRKRRRKKGAGGETSGMARVAWGGMRAADAIVAVEDEVLLYDLRVRSSCRRCTKLAAVLTSQSWSPVADQRDRPRRRERAVGTFPLSRIFTRQSRLATLPVADTSRRAVVHDGALCYPCRLHDP